MKKGSGALMMAITFMFLFLSFWPLGASKHRRFAIPWQNMCLCGAVCSASLINETED